MLYELISAHILIIFSVLLTSLAMLFGHEVFATIEVPNMTETEPPSGFTPTPDLYTKPIPLEKLAMSALFAPDERSPPDSGWYRMTAFGLNLTPNSQLCPENNCQFGFEVGELIPDTSASRYILVGGLKVETQQTTGVSSQTYQVRGNLDIVQTFEEPGKITYLLADGELNIGRGIVIYGGEFDYRITNGSLVFTPGQDSLVIMGERSPTLDEQSQSSKLTALAQPANTTAQQQLQQQPANTTTLQQQQPVIGQTPLSQLQQSTTTPTLSTLQQQQQPLPPPSNISQQQLQLQQTLPGQVMQQQQPLYQQLPLVQQQQPSSIYQPTAQVPPTIQRHWFQLLFAFQVHWEDIIRHH